MIIDIKYFGMLAEITGCSNEKFECSNTKISELKKNLINRYPGLNNVNFTIAQDQEIVNENNKITGEEVAIFPPFSGG
ncbi:MoaD/ThiS family protein [Aquimarina sp. 2-A2]|uniref:MoaD/ThiS family protein n=1 Tax=Aquimarina sp. 2-A2 TaxID=3382644 RepID=UPI00387F019A